MFFIKFTNALVFYLLKLMHATTAWTVTAFQLFKIRRSRSLDEMFQKVFWFQEIYKRVKGMLTIQRVNHRTKGSLETIFQKRGQGGKIFSQLILLNVFFFNQNLQNRSFSRSIRRAYMHPLTNHDGMTQLVNLLFACSWRVFVKRKLHFEVLFSCSFAWWPYLKFCTNSYPIVIPLNCAQFLNFVCSSRCSFCETNFLLL